MIQFISSFLQNKLTEYRCYVSDYAFAGQSNPSLTADGSVLVSPFLNISMVSCFKTEYFLESSAYVDGFIEYNDTPKTVTRLFSSSRRRRRIYQFTTVQHHSTSASAQIRQRKINKSPRMFIS